MPTTRRVDPYRGYRFRIEVDGVDGSSLQGAFSEVSGLEAAKLGSIILKRGLIRDAGFRDWILDAHRGKVRRANGRIVLSDETGREVMRWNFLRGWPSKWTGPGLNAAGTDVAMETLEISHDGLQTEAAPRD